MRIAPPDDARTLARPPLRNAAHWRSNIFTSRNVASHSGTMWLPGDDTLGHYRGTDFTNMDA
jgi:hypothetical protein